MIQSDLDRTSHSVLLKRLMSGSSETPEGEGGASPLKAFTTLIKTTPFQNMPRTAVLDVPHPQFQPNKLPELNCMRDSECPISPGINCVKNQSPSTAFESPRSSSNTSGELLRGILKGGHKSRFSIEGQSQLSARRNSGDTKVTLQLQTTETKDNRNRALNRISLH